MITARAIDIAGHPHHQGVSGAVATAGAFLCCASVRDVLASALVAALGNAHRWLPGHRGGRPADEPKASLGIKEAGTLA
jgi:hypothetical protein